jgi:hypothetical protein
MRIANCKIDEKIFRKKGAVMRKFETKVKKDEWYEPFEEEKDVKVKVKPFSILHLTRLPSGEGDFGPEQMFNVFKKCTVDWKGIVDDKGKPLPCTDENKTRVFDQDFELASLVVSHAISLKTQVLSEKESKNLSTSQSGQETKEEV